MGSNEKKIDWKKELFTNRRFNVKFPKNLLEYGVKDLMQGISLKYMYSRWRKIRGLNNDDSVENKEKMQS